MIKRLLLALDGSTRSPGVFAAAVEIAQRFGAVVIPFRAIDVPPEFPPAAHVSHGDPLPHYLEQRAAQEIRAFFEKTDVSWEYPVIGHGQAWRAILEAAEENNVDLIVLGSHGYHPLDRILGTTAGKVANLARRSVLVVHDRVEPPDSEALLDEDEHHSRSQVSRSG